LYNRLIPYNAHSLQRQLEITSQHQVQANTAIIPLFNTVIPEEEEKDESFDYSEVSKKIETLSSQMIQLQKDVDSFYETNNSNNTSKKIKQNS